MLSSIQCAARWDGWDTELTHFVITLGDQPHLRLETLSSLLHFAMKHRRQVSQPTLGGKPAHPVVLPRHLFGELSATKEPTLKEFLRHRETAAWAIEDPGLGIDIDRPEDYARALALVGL